MTGRCYSAALPGALELRRTEPWNLQPLQEAAPKPKKRPASSDASPAPKKAKAPKAAAKEKPAKLNKDGKPKKARAKKDKNAPKNVSRDVICVSWRQLVCFGVLCMCHH